MREDLSKPAGLGRYVWKHRPELYFGILGGVLTFAVDLAVHFSPETITDWRTFAVASAGGLVRAVGVAVAATFGMAKIRFRDE